MIISQYFRPDLFTHLHAYVSVKMTWINWITTVFARTGYSWHQICGGIVTMPEGNNFFNSVQALCSENINSDCSSSAFSFLLVNKRKRAVSFTQWLNFQLSFFFVFCNSVFGQLVCNLCWCFHLQRTISRREFCNIS